MPIRVSIINAVPPPANHQFRKPDDPPELANELEQIRHSEWKFTSIGNAVLAAEFAVVRMALLRGYDAGLRAALKSGVDTNEMD